jgi:NAD(P)-dependent dehydrogenase (short-subunit alcohol dehydrogenase family)
VHDVAGKVAVITGGAAGIGLGIVEACVEAGMRVAVVDVRGDVLDAVVQRLGDRGADVVGLQADVSRLDDVRRVASDVLDAFGGVHYVHNNAGIALFEPMSDVTLEEFRWVMDVNFWSVFHGVQVFRPIVERQAEGYISASSSMAGLLGVAGQPAYNASKHAVIGMMTTLERELRAVGSTVHASVLCPTSVASDIIAATQAYRAATIGVADPPAGTDVHAFGSSTASPAKQRSFEALLRMIDGIEHRSASDVGREVLAQVLEPRFWLFTEPTWMQHVREQVERSIEDGSLTALG